MRTALAVLALALLTATPTNAEVTARADNGFAVSHKVTVSVDPEEAFAMLRTPAKWWAKEHSWTGNADNLYMDAQAGGCFCELIPNKATTESGAPQRTLRGSVQHMQMLYVDPGKMLRLSGALGPLQGEAMAGTLTVRLTPIKGGTELAFEYVVGGYMRMATGEMAPAVDGVIVEQASRLAMALGPLVGGGTKIDANPAEEAAVVDESVDETPDAATKITQPSSNVGNLVADLEPDDEAALTPPDDAAEVVSEPAGKPAAMPVAKPGAPSRPAPGTRPLTPRPAPRDDEPESGR